MNGAFIHLVHEAARRSTHSVIAPAITAIVKGGEKMESCAIMARIHEQAAKA
ncbi:hypothetical protein [Dokdonella sp.]|uniref:hypothetical protein n=1 Tax=Dokdonella sp. TaxID=2291710 RepID=UPI003C546212